MVMKNISLLQQGKNKQNLTVVENFKLFLLQETAALILNCLRDAEIRSVLPAMLKGAKRLATWCGGCGHWRCVWEHHTC
jgi:hypothetical protein